MRRRYSFVSAGLGSGGKKKNPGLRLLCVLAAAVLLLAGAFFLANPRETLRSRHVYAYSDSGAKILDVELYRDEVRSIVIHDESGAVLGSLSAYKNDWGRDGTFSATDPATGITTRLIFTEASEDGNGLDLPEYVRQSYPDKPDRIIYYDIRTGMPTYTAEEKTEEWEILKAISYDPEGYIERLSVSDDEKGTLVYTMRPELELSYKAEQDDHMYAVWYAWPDGSDYSGLVMRNPNDGLFLQETYGLDRTLTSFTLSLSRIGIFTSENVEFTCYPSEEALLNPPMKTVEYDEQGRVSKVSWENLEEQSEYLYSYHDDGSPDRIEYTRADLNNGSFFLSDPQTVFVFNEDGHIGEIIGKNHYSQPFRVLFAYNDHGQFQSAVLYGTDPDSGREKQSGQHTYHYNEQNQLKSIDAAFDAIYSKGFSGTVTVRFGEDGSITSIEPRFGDKNKKNPTALLPPASAEWKQALPGM